MGRGEAGILLGSPAAMPASRVHPGGSPAPVGRNFSQPVREHEFAHPAERDLARILSFYRIRWVYEPTTFHLEFREDGRPAEPSPTRPVLSVDAQTDTLRVSWDTTSGVLKKRERNSYISMSARVGTNRQHVQTVRTRSTIELARLTEP